MKGIGIRGIGLTRRMVMGGDDGSLKIYTDADNTSTFDPSWAFSDASVMTVNWGDGTPQESHATALTHTYAAGSGRKLVRFSCPDWTKLTSFDINGDVCVSQLPSFAMCTGLTNLTMNNNEFVGPPPSFAANIALQYLIMGWKNFFSGPLQSFATNTQLIYITMDYQLFTGIIQSFATCTLLTTFIGYGNQFNGYATGGFATQRDLAVLNLWTNILPVASIDAILADCVTSLAIPGRVVCTLSLHGVGNAPPSNPAGLVSKATLVAAGWPVTTN